MRRLIVVLFAAVAAMLAAAASADARYMAVGMADDAVLIRGGVEADEAVAAWAALGVDTVRIQVSWARIAPSPTAPVPPLGFQPTNPDDPLYQWGVVDSAIARLRNHGIRPILMITGAPPLWASGRPSRGNPRYRPSAPAYANFATAVATRYGAVADDYILWNEPNLPLWLQPQGACGKRRCTPVSPHVYREMVRAAYPAIHAADGSAKVLIGALAPAGSNLRSANANMRPLEFIRAMGCVDDDLEPITRGPCAGFQPALADGFAYHPHSTRHAPTQPYDHPDNADIGSLKSVEGLLDRLQNTGRLVGSTRPLGLWLDEYGYQTNPPDRLRGVSPGAQDRYLQQAAYLAWRDPRVQLLAQYVWTDETVAGGRRYTGWQSGLRFFDGRPKPALSNFDNPVWADIPRGIVWGQVRPGADHQVHVQRRMPGSGTWEPVGEVLTGQDGGWQIRTPVVPFAAYRSVTGSGRISGAVIAVPPGDAVPDGGTSSDKLDRRTIGRIPGAAIPRSFAGFSIEYWAADSYLGATKVNPIFARLVETLAASGNGAPTIRLGGNSTDENWWNPSAAPRPGGIVTDMTPAKLAVMRAFAARTNSPFLLGLNLALNDVANSVTYAQAAAQALPPGHLAAFEIGNEPDLYTTPRRFQVGNRVMQRGQRRPAGWDYPEYVEELRAFREALAGAAPGVPVSEGGFATASWEDHAADMLARGGPGPTQFSAHAYALHTCENRLRRQGARYSRALLGTTAFTPVVNRMSQLTGVASSFGAPFRLSEANSANCGGVRGASDSFASALWGADLLFGLANAGVRNVNFHTFNGAFYAPVDFGLRKGRRVARVHPLFYGMLLFSRAVPQDAQLLPAGPNPPGATLKTWATVDGIGTRRIVLINKSQSPRTVALNVPGGSITARVRRLLAPSSRAHKDVTFGGQGYGTSTPDGELRGKATVEKIKRTSASFRMIMPPASAALVTVRRG
ncbi:MAG: hypothetical protein QOH46_1518 [Solirubrobacteraceae bacterium]|nr:hypothetical protein [Solirubrobacteraceae bacterium]